MNHKRNVKGWFAERRLLCKMGNPNQQQHCESTPEQPLQTRENIDSRRNELSERLQKVVQRINAIVPRVRNKQDWEDYKASLLQKFAECDRVAAGDTRAFQELDTVLKKYETHVLTSENILQKKGENRDRTVTNGGQIDLESVNSNTWAVIIPEGADVSVEQNGKTRVLRHNETMTGALDNRIDSFLIFRDKNNPNYIKIASNNGMPKSVQVIPAKHKTNEMKKDPSKDADPSSTQEKKKEGAGRQPQEEMTKKTEHDEGIKKGLNNNDKEAKTNNNDSGSSVSKQENWKRFKQGKHTIDVPKGSVIEYKLLEEGQWSSFDPTDSNDGVGIYKHYQITKDRGNHQIIYMELDTPLDIRIRDAATSKKEHASPKQEKATSTTAKEDAEEEAARRERIAEERVRKENRQKEFGLLTSGYREPTDEENNTLLQHYSDLFNKNIQELTTRRDKYLGEQTIENYKRFNDLKTYALDWSKEKIDYRRHEFLVDPQEDPILKALEKYRSTIRDQYNIPLNDSFYNEAGEYRD